jgi:phenylacetate-CoA ligase
MDDLALPRSRDEIRTLQEQLKARALEQARRAPFHRGRLKGVRHWRDIPLLEKEALRALSPDEFYREFCVGPREDWRELWRSGGTTGKPLFYPRTAEDLHWAMIGFRRVYHCVGAGAGDLAHLSLPLGIHPAGQMMARAGEREGVAMAWVGAGAAAPSELQLDLLALFRPTMWIGMSSYGIHLANLARTKEIDLKTLGVRKIITTAEPLSKAKREKLEREWNARVFDSFGMTECMMMGCEHPEDGEAALGFRTWSDFAHLEVLDAKTLEPVPEGEEGVLVVTPLRTNHATPFLRWNTGDIVALTDRPGNGPYGVFPLVRHAHRTAGFFKVRGVNIGHGELEDHLFALREVADFRCEVVNDGGLDQLLLIVELREGCGSEALEGSVKRVFEITPRIRAVAPGTIAREFESAVKAPRFLDRR